VLEMVSQDGSNGDSAGAAPGVGDATGAAPAHAGQDPTNQARPPLRQGQGWRSPPARAAPRSAEGGGDGSSVCSVSTNSSSAIHSSTF